MKLRTILIGSTPMANKLIDLLQEMECVDLVMTFNLNPVQAVNKSNYNPMLKTLRDNPMKLQYISNINDKWVVNMIKSYKPDLIIQAGWSQIFKEEILNIPTLSCVGIHSAPLPHGKGGAILNWKLIDGGGEWGCSLFIMNKGIDTGAILDFKSFELEERDDIRTAYLKADSAALKMIERTLPLIAKNSITAKEQKEGGSYYHRRYPEDGRMQFDWSVKEILNYVRALTHPYPGAYFETKYGKLIVWKAEHTNMLINLTNRKKEIGSILGIINGKGLIIKVGNDEAIRLTEVTPPNNVETWCDIWALENNFKIGDNLK